MGQIDWRSDEAVGAHRRRSFVVTHDGVDVPAILTTPRDPVGPIPLILLAHGGSNHKTHPTTEIFCMRLMEAGELAVATIDFPEHGERGLGLDSIVDPAFLDLLADPSQFDQASADLSAVLTESIATGEFDTDRIGYWGVSLGGWFGFPFVADEQRLTAAVLGLIGTGSALLDATGHERPGRNAVDRAPDVSIPTAFIIQWEDQVVPRADALDAFGKIGTVERRLFAAPGDHALIPTDVFDATRQFLLDRFAGKPLPGPILASVFEAATG